MPGRSGRSDWHTRLGYRSRVVGERSATRIQRAQQSFDQLQGLRSRGGLVDLCRRAELFRSPRLGANADWAVDRSPELGTPARAERLVEI
jgi:hypothetical protein